MEKGLCSLQGGSAESVTEPSDPQSAAEAALGYPGIWKHPSFALISHEAGAGSCSEAELPSFQPSIRSCALARNRATTGDADLPFARTAHSAGLRPGVTVVPVSAGSDLMCVSHGPASPCSYTLAYACVLFNIHQARRKAVVSFSIMPRGTPSERT